MSEKSETEEVNHPAVIGDCPRKCTILLCIDLAWTALDLLGWIALMYHEKEDCI